MNVETEAASVHKSQVGARTAIHREAEGISRRNISGWKEITVKQPWRHKWNKDTGAWELKHDYTGHGSVPSKVPSLWYVVPYTWPPTKIRLHHIPIWNVLIWSTWCFWVPVTIRAKYILGKDQKARNSCYAKRTFSRSFCLEAELAWEQTIHYLLSGIEQFVHSDEWISLKIMCFSAALWSVRHLAVSAPWSIRHFVDSE